MILRCTSDITRSFYKQRFFSTQPQCCLTFAWIQVQMLLRCCLIYISIIIHTETLFTFTVFVCMSRPRSIYLFMSYLCDLFFIFTFIFIMIHRIISWIQTHLFFCLFFRICPNYFVMITWMKNLNNFQIAKVQP